MKTVSEIIEAIEALPKPELYQIVAWVEIRRDEIEDPADLATAGSILAEDGPRIPWDEVKRQCGLPA